MFDYAVVDEMVQKIARDLSPKMIIIFGSVARGEATDDSDVDLLVVMDTDREWYNRSYPVRECLDDFMIPMDIIVVTPKEFEDKKDDQHSFINEIVTTGRVAYAV